jgi:NAD(P)-dependent dehydrogenase (short-subunit alcohol dehydrogenase family)
MNIENKTVLVTGSTDGVGRLVARRLADQGARVLIHGRDRTRGEQLLNEIRAAHRGSAAFLPADFFFARRGASPRRHRPPGM